MRKWFRTAVLMIHGFSGSLADNEYLVNKIQLDSRYDVYAWTLPGHNQDIIRKVTMGDWVNAVDEQIAVLKKDGYHRIIVIGHSMGGVLAGYLASKYTEIKKVIFVSAAYEYFAGTQYRKDLFNLKETKRDPDIAYGKFITKFFRVPLTTVKEFQALIKAKKTCLMRISVPALVLHGENDDIVPITAADYIVRHIRSKDKTKTIIKSARHNVLSGKRKEETTEYIYSFIKGGRTWKQMKKSEL